MGGRKLRLKARAERMAQTRRRIVEAAYGLHCTVGPARTTISAVAERAGVQRHTVYQHFPDELALFGACTAHGLAIDPPPDPAAVGAIEDPRARLRATLAQLYAYYRRNESLLANIARDEPELLQRTRDAGIDWRDVPETVRRYSDLPIELRNALVRGWRARGTRSAVVNATVGLALGFGTWRALVHDGQLEDERAVELMVQLVICSATAPGSRAGRDGPRRKAGKESRARARAALEGPEAASASIRAGWRRL